MPSIKHRAVPCIATFALATGTFLFAPAAMPSAPVSSADLPGSAGLVSVAWADGSYIIPYSSSAVLTDADLAGLNGSQLYLARNEIYARHGYIFADEYLKSYFGSKSWYTPLYTAEQFDQNCQLSYIENKNIALILEYEQGRGGGDSQTPSYVFPQSSTTLLTDADVAGSSSYRLYLARNEIYARHGYIFENKDLQQYFAGKSWYTPRYTAAQFDESVLSNVEQRNIALILRYENGSGQTVDSSYIFPYSSTSLLGDADLRGRSAWELEIARNEIYARHGYIFSTKSLADYFSGKSWYVPRYTAEQFNDGMLNDIEQRNIGRILTYENGGSFVPVTPSQPSAYASGYGVVSYATTTGASGAVVSGNPGSPVSFETANGTVFCTWRSQNAFDFTTMSGTHINGCYVSDWDNQTATYKVLLWTDDGRQVFSMVNGATRWAHLDSWGNVSEWL